MENDKINIRNIRIVRLFLGMKVWGDYSIKKGRVEAPEFLSVK